MSDKNPAHYFLRGGGEMGKLIRAKDWSKTSLGDPSTWPQSLQTMVSVMLNNPFGMYIAWGSEYIQLYNDGYRPILGSTKHPDALGISTRETFAEIWDNIIGSMFEGVMKGEAVGYPDLMLPLNRNGFVEECYFDFSYSPIIKNDGEVGGVLVTVIETTNKRNTEEALRESEARFRAIADDAPVFIFLAGENAAVDYLNKTWREYTGISAEDSKGRAWAEITHPDDIDPATKIYMDGFNKRKSCSFENRQKGIDGIYRTILWKATPRFSLNGQFIGMMGVGFDIHERKQSEEKLRESEQRLRLAIQASGVAVWEWNVITGQIKWDNEMFKIYGVTPTGDNFVDYTTWSTAVAPEELAQQENILQKTVKNKGQSSRSFNIKRASDGELRYIDAIETVRTNEAGQVEWVVGTNLDVTEQKLAQKQIEESQALLQTVFRQAPAAIALLEGAAHTFALANSRYQKMISRSEEQLLGKTMKEVFPEFEGTGTIEIFDNVFETGQTFSMAEYPLMLDINNDGIMQQQYFNFTAEPIKAEGKVASIMVMVYNITEQVEARKKIEESESRLQLLTDALPVLIAYVDKNTRYRFNNKAYEDWFGYASKELFGKQLKDVLGETAYENLKPKIAQVLSGRPVHFEMSVPYKDGGTRWVVADYIPHFGNDSEVLGFYAVVNDITAIKNAERLNWKLAAIVQSSEDAIISKTLDGIITSWNPGAEKIFGYSAAEMIDKPIHIIIPPDRREEEPSLINQISNGETVHHFETKRLHKDGKLIDISLTVSPIKDNEGNIIGASKIARDITESIEARKKIEQSEKQQAFLLKMSDALRPLINPIDIEEAITKIALDFLEADRCYYCDIDEDSAIILRDAWRGDLQSVAGVHPISSFALYKAILKAGHPFVIDDVQTSNILDEDLKKVCMQFKYGSFINVPVIKNGKSVGLFSVVQCKPRKWTEAEVQLTIETAERTWAAVERAKGEGALRQSEEKYRTLFNSIDQGFLLGEVIRNNEGKGIDYYVHEVNSTYEKQTGINIEMVLGKTVLQAFPTIDKWWIETYAAVVDNQYPVRFEKFFEFTNRWFDIKASPTGNEMFTILFTDITESRQAIEKIKESEERFRSLAQTLPQLVWMTDAEGNQEFASFRWKEYSGIEPDGEKEWREIVHPDDYDGINAAWTKSLTTGTVYKADVRLKNKAGEYRWYTVIGEPVLDSENKIVKWVGAFTDIQEQKIKEEKKDEFISIASHEMKTPLTTAKAYLQMLELMLDENNGDAILYTKKANQSVNRLNELISELLDVSKIRLGKLNYTVTTFNFNDMIESTVENIQLTSLKHSIIKTGEVNVTVTGIKKGCSKWLLIY